MTTGCQSLSFVVPLVVPLIVIRCLLFHSLYYSLLLAVTGCHSMYPRLSFYQRSETIVSRTKALANTNYKK